MLETWPATSVANVAASRARPGLAVAVRANRNMGMPPWTWLSGRRALRAIVRAGGYRSASLPGRAPGRRDTVSGGGVDDLKPTSTRGARMQFKVLGPLELVGPQGNRIRLASDAQRRLVSHLVLRANTIVRAEE